jgi:hypothetical protein
MTKGNVKLDSPKGLHFSSGVLKSKIKKASLVETMTIYGSEFEI